jgi:hypothetical protein
MELDITKKVAQTPILFIIVAVIALAIVMRKEWLVSG